MDAQTRAVEIDGEIWTIREQRTSLDNVPSLVFSCDRVARRVCDYPSDWLSLSDSELRALASHR
jgi:hypothetical protein